MFDWGWMADVLVGGAAAAGTSMIVRALTPQAWRSRRPWSCKLCLSVWSALLIVVAAIVDGLIGGPITAALVVGVGMRYLGMVAVSVLVLVQSGMFVDPLFGGDAGRDGDVDA